MSPFCLIDVKRMHTRPCRAARRGRRLRVVRWLAVLLRQCRRARQVAQTDGPHASPATARHRAP